MQKRVMVLVHCTSPRQDLSSDEAGTSYTFCVMFRTKFRYEKITKGNNSCINKKIVMLLVHCTSQPQNLSSNEVWC